MRFDVARAMWLYVRGGVYADLDVEALRNVEPALRGAHLVLMGDDSIHDADTCPPMRDQPRRLPCGPHIGNYFMASVPGHPFWLFYLRYVADNVGSICHDRASDALRSFNILELTGPWGMGRAFGAYMKHKAELNGSWPALSERLLDRASFFPSAKHAPPRPTSWDRKQNVTAVDHQAPLGSMHVAAVWQAVEHDRADYDYRRIHKPMRQHSLRSNGSARSSRSHASRRAAANATHVVICIYGIVSRSIQYTWPLIQERLVWPLQAQGAKIRVVFFHVDVEQELVDGVHVNGTLAAKLIRAHIGSSQLKQTSVDNELRQECAPAVAPGCYTMPQCAAREACAPHRQRCPPFIDPRRQRPYDVDAQRNAYRQLHTERRVAAFLRTPHGLSYDVAMAVTCDLHPMTTIKWDDILLLTHQRNKVLGSDQNDRYGYTNGFLAARPSTLALVMGRLDDLIARRLPAEQLPTDYEGLLKISMDVAGLHRRPSSFSFVKVRATGALGYKDCLSSAEERKSWPSSRSKSWIMACTGDRRHLPPPRPGGATLLRTAPRLEAFCDRVDVSAVSLVAHPEDIQPQYQTNVKTGEAIGTRRTSRKCHKSLKSCRLPARQQRDLSTAEQYRVERYLGRLTRRVAHQVHWPFGRNVSTQIECEAIKLAHVDWTSPHLPGCFEWYTCDISCFLNALSEEQQAKGPLARLWSWFSASRQPHMGSKLLWVEGDPDWHVRLPTLIKSRPVDRHGRSYGVLLPMEWSRHFGPLNTARRLAAPPFALRSSVAVWRGVTTGNDCNPETNQRMRFVRQWANASSAGGVRLDVGFTHAVQCFGDKDLPLWMRKRTVKMESMFKNYKYLLSIEGNDVATNLAWILHADAVPLMPTPRIETWLLHGDLKAWTHYVPLRPDFTDLAKQLAWLEANPTRAAEIARAGRAFVAPYGDRGRDILLAAAVLKRYLSAVSVVSS